MGQTRWIGWCVALCCLSHLGWTTSSIRMNGVTPDLERRLLPLARTLLEETSGGPSLQRARADAAAETLRQRLQSLGYLEAVVRAEPQIRAIVFEVDLGKRFLVDRIRWEIVEDQETHRVLTTWPEAVTRILLATNVGDFRGKPLEVEPFTQLQKDVAKSLRDEGFAFAEPERLRLRADALTEQVNITLPVLLGPRVWLGPTSIDGLERLRTTWVERRLRWCEGDLFNPEKIESTRDLLMRSGLFNKVETQLGTPKVGEQLYPVLLTLQERKPRTLSAGVTYATTEGVGGLFGWEHRNLDGLGERLSADLIVAQVIQEFNLSGRRSVNQRPDLTWLGFAVARRKHVLSYLERSADLALLLEWECDRQLIASGGIKVEGLTVRDSPENGQNLIGSFPFFLSWSDFDDPGRPRSGASLQLRAAPTAVSGVPSSLFFPFRLAASVTIPFGKASLAWRATLGSILGASLESIPLPLRFFEGSVDGLRGYAYQTVSPLNSCGIPIGGRSLLLFNAELRAPISSTIELIPFVDIGNVFSQEWPNFNVRPLTALGLGIRYDSLLGPLRLDIALPLNRRPDIDKPFSLYFGVGQTF